MLYPDNQSYGFLSTENVSNDDTFSIACIKYGTKYGTKYYPLLLRGYYSDSNWHQDLSKPPAICKPFYLKNWNLYSVSDNSILQDTFGNNLVVNSGGQNNLFYPNQKPSTAFGEVTMFPLNNAIIYKQVSDKISLYTTLIYTKINSSSEATHCVASVYNYTITNILALENKLQPFVLEQIISAANSNSYFTSESNGYCVSGELTTQLFYLY